jgi:hypothetical protein
MNINVSAVQQSTSILRIYSGRPFSLNIITITNFEFEHVYTGLIEFTANACNPNLLQVHVNEQERKSLQLLLIRLHEVIHLEQEIMHER